MEIYQAEKLLPAAEKLLFVRTTFLCVIQWKDITNMTTPFLHAPLLISSDDRSASLVFDDTTSDDKAERSSEP